MPHMSNSVPLHLNRDLEVPLSKLIFISLHFSLRISLHIVILLNRSNTRSNLFPPCDASTDTFLITVQDLITECRRKTYRNFLSIFPAACRSVQRCP